MERMIWNMRGPCITGILGEGIYLTTHKHELVEMNIFK